MQCQSSILVSKNFTENRISRPVEIIRSVNIISRHFLKKYDNLLTNRFHIETFYGRRKKKELKQNLVTPRKRKRNYQKKKNKIFLYILACDITIELAFFPFSNIWVPVNRGRSKESEDTVWFDSTSVSSTYQVTSQYKDWPFKRSK